MKNYAHNKSAYRPIAGKKVVSPRLQKVQHVRCALIRNDVAAMSKITSLCLSGLPFEEGRARGKLLSC